MIESALIKAEAKAKEGKRRRRQNRRRRDARRGIHRDGKKPPKKSFLDRLLGR